MYVKINSLTHTWVGDLDMYVESPSGQRLGLSDQTGNVNNSGDNFTNTVFADSGTAILPTTGAPYSALYKPWNQVFTVSSCTGNSTSLTTFSGLGGGSLNPNGTWSLKAYDRASTDTGRVVSWSIFFPYQTYTCTTVSNPVSLTFQAPPAVTSFSPSSGNSGTLVTVNGTGFSTATSVQLNGAAVSFTLLSSSQLTFTVPAGASSGVVTVVNPCGTGSSSSSFTFISQLSLQVTLLVEGLHSGSAGSMVPVASPSLADTVRIELHNTIAPYGLVQTFTGIPNLGGQMSLTLPGSLLGQSYYLVVRHRNSLETWSKLPVTLGNSTSYTFK
jgi:subtilisin-like proprotein convertase family protein